MVKSVECGRIIEIFKYVENKEFLNQIIQVKVITV